MKLSEVGVAQEIDLSPSWYRQLSDHQAAAYIRYQYIWRHEHAWDWDTPAHSRVRRSWDGGKDAFGVKYSCGWTKILAAARLSNADLGAWVAAHFSDIGLNQMIAQTHTLPEVRPTFLRSSTSPALYQKYCSTLPGVLRQAFQVAGDTIASRLRGTAVLGMAPDDHAFYVLCDEAYVSASPFFRYVFSEQLNCQRGVERYLWLAALEYESQQRLYDIALGNDCAWGPLRAAVCEIRKHWKEYA